MTLGCSGYSSEDCDDGNLLDGDGCSKKCLMETGFNCKGESVSVSVLKKGSNPRGKEPVSTLEQTQNNSER